MCGRYLLRAPLDLLRRAFGIEEVSEIRIVPRFNIAPTQQVILVRDAGTGRRELVQAKWGLIPAWAKEASIGSRMINARAEGLDQKPAFRAAFKARRAIIPASGFYEWQRRAGGKVPHLIRRRDGEPMGFAGLWESWIDSTTGEVVTSCTIITTEANELMAELHDRMPVILDPADYDRWLDLSRPDALALLRPCPSDWLEAYPVSTRVNRPANDDEGLTEPAQTGDLFG